LDIAIQIFSGGFTGKTVLFETVEEKLFSILPRLPVSKVIMGWSLNKTLYEKTAEFLAKNNIAFYLWFPVFSETGAFAINDPNKKLSPLIDVRGNELEKKADHTGEDFSFCCPNDPQNIENILSIFDENFSSIPFTGIFLDKIRYPSFAQGKQSVFTCFCPHCRSEYEKEGFDISYLENLFFKQNTTPFGITGYRGNGQYDFDDPVMSRFFSLKSRIVSRSLSRICGYFRDRGLAIGLDVFAPFLSPFVGQDLLQLSGLCGFIKPMMYRATQAPAGLPFETEALLHGTESKNTTKEQAFYGLLGFDPGKKVFDLDFTVRELRSLASVSACSVCPGVEINRIKNLADVYPDYIEETIMAYFTTGVRGLVLSWDLLEAPEENVVRAADTIPR